VARVLSRKRSFFRWLGGTIGRKGMQAWAKELLDKVDVDEFIASGGRYLDVGCGLGYCMAELASRPRARSARLFGVDLFTYPTDPVQQQLGHNFALADATVLPFGPATFDGATLLFVLHHMARADHAAVVGELSRVVGGGPGRFICIAEDLVETPEEWPLVEEIDRKLNFESKRQAHSYRSHADWLAFFQELRLDVVRSHVFTTTIKARQPWINWRPEPVERKHGVYVLHAHPN